MRITAWNRRQDGSNVSSHAPLFVEVITYIFIKRPSFVTSYSGCYSFHHEEINDNAATFIYESLHILQKVKTVKRFKPASLFELFLLLSGDIEIFPGRTPREIPKLDALLKAKGKHIFHQNVRGLLCKNGYLVDSIDSFKKV